MYCHGQGTHSLSEERFGNRYSYISEQHIFVFSSFKLACIAMGFVMLSDADFIIIDILLHPSAPISSSFAH